MDDLLMFIFSLVPMFVGIRLTDRGLAECRANPVKFEFTIADVLTSTPRVSFMPILVSRYLCACHVMI